MTSSFPDDGTYHRQPLVVVIDDEDQGDFAELITDQGVQAVAVRPNDLDQDLLGSATAVVMDQYLDHWPERDRLALPPALHVSDGLAMSAVLRSHVERSGSRTDSTPRPVAFALRTGELERLGAGMPKTAREHLLARQYNLEWVFSKGDSSIPNLPSPARRVADLAVAASTLPTNWGPNSGNPGSKWLALPEAIWTEDAIWQIEQCRPPQHVVAERTAGVAWLRWFLHRILPFPTFLYGSIHLAAHLGITLASAESLINSDSPLSGRLDELRYRGPLSNFLGLRWWRAGVSALADELHVLGEADGLERTHAIAAGAAHLHGSPLETLEMDDPVVGINADYAALRTPLSAASAVRLQPDDWPPYADDAWASRELLEDEEVDPELRAMVVSIDRWRIGQRHDDHENPDGAEAIRQNDSIDGK